MNPSIGDGVAMTSSELAALEASFLNKSGNVPLHQRYKALFSLTDLKSPDVIRIISEGFQDESALLRHEMAFCHGQIRDGSALPILKKILENNSEDPIVRHEAAQGMGAISSPSSIPVLTKYLSDSARVVRETCELSIALIEWDRSEEGQQFSTSINPEANRSIDPAPPTLGFFSGQLKPEDLESKTLALKTSLLDTRLPLFERYRAIFALRNIGTPSAVDALASGFSDDSELFKHEIASVFSHLLSPHSVPSLLQVLQNSKESDMVRHEVIGALGDIAAPEALPYLKEWMNREDAPRIIRESCQVALNM